MTERKAVHVTTDGEASTVTLTGTGSEQFREVQGLCGSEERSATIERLTLFYRGVEFELWCDEDGHGVHPANYRATDICGVSGASHVLLTIMFGPVVFTGPLGDDGFGDLPREGFLAIDRVLRDNAQKPLTVENP